MSDETKSFYDKLWQIISSEKGKFFSDSQKHSHYYEELKNNILLCCEIFHVHKQEKVAVLCDKTFLNYCSILGILFSENIWVPMSNSSPDGRNVEIIENLEAKFIITDRVLTDPVIERAKQLKISVIVISELFSRQPDENFEPQCCKNKPKDLSMIYYTSGSTGVPKGVMIKNESFVNNISNICAIIKLEKSKFIDLHDPSFVISIPIIFPCILSRSELFVANSETDIIFPGNAIMRENVQTVITVPSTLSRIISDKNLPSIIQSLKYVVSCGEPLSFEILEPFLKNKKLLFFNFYGSTEVAPWIFFHQCTDKTLKYRDSQNFVPVGRLLDGNKMAINEDGMLLIKGVQITPGYVGHKTDSHLIQHDGELWFPMQDTVDEIDGIYFCKGRMDGVLKVKGYRVHMSDIEINLKKIPGVQECICFIVGGKINAFVFSETIRDKKTIIVNAKEMLPNYMMPSNVVIKKTMPLNKNGKVDRARIRALI